MSGTSNEIFLVYNASRQIRLDVDVKQYKLGDQNILLYAGNDGQQRYFSDTRNSSTEARNVCDLLDGFSTEEFKNFIELFTKYETGIRSFEALLKFTFAEAFVKKIKSVMGEPSISLNGQYLATLSKPYFDQPVCWRYFGNSDIPITMEQGIWKRFEGAHGLQEFCNYNTSFPINFAFQDSVKLKWKEFGLSLKEDKINVLEKLMNDKLFADCFLVASNNVEVSCHRNIISVHSDVLYTMLTSGLRESETYKIEMKEMSEEGLKSLVSYFYHNQVDVEDVGEDVSFELLQAGHKYNVANLEATIANQLYLKSPDLFGIGNVLSLYRLTSNIDELEMLCDEMLNILKKNPKEQRTTNAYQDLLTNHPQAAADLAFHLLEKLTV